MMRSDLIFDVWLFRWNLQQLLWLLVKLPLLLAMLTRFTVARCCCVSIECAICTSGTEQTEYTIDISGLAADAAGSCKGPPDTCDDRNGSWTVVNDLVFLGGCRYTKLLTGGCGGNGFLVLWLETDGFSYNRLDLTIPENGSIVYRKTFSYTAQDCGGFAETMTYISGAVDCDISGATVTCTS